MRERGTTCPNELHDYPLAPGYCAASEEADERLTAKWRNLRCPDCNLYGWKPPRAVGGGEQ